MLGDRQALAAGRVEQAGADGLEYVSNGRPLPGTELRIDADPGHIGEVQLRSKSMLSDYVGADLELTDDGFFPTRDLGFIVDDEIYLVGRSDDSIIVGGKNYYAADVEAEVSHDEVRPGNLAAIPNETGFSVVCELRVDPEPADAERVCRELVRVINTTVGIRPAAVSVVARGTLFKTPSGKLQRPLIAKALASGELVPIATVTFGGLS